MKREFIYLQNFDKVCKALGLPDDAQRDLESMILERPDIGEVVQGAGGLRKARFGLNNKGKSGGMRVLYVDFESHRKTYFLLAYPKSESETITSSQKQAFRNKIDTLLNELREKGSK